jgi:transcriptional regulator with XRE-family HTH domain
MLTIGTKIKKLRELRNYTQENMAGKLQMSANGYGKIERDETDVSYSRMQQIADIIGLTPADIINFDENIVFGGNHHDESVRKTGVEDHERIVYEQEITHLRQENEYLKEIVRLLKNKK